MSQLPRFEIIDGSIVDVLRRKTPVERVEMTAAANRTARLIAAAAVRYQHPNWDEQDVQAEVIRRVTGGTD